MTAAIVLANVRPYSEAPCWHAVTDYEVEHYDSREDARAAEDDAREDGIPFELVQLGEPCWVRQCRATGCEVFDDDDGTFAVAHYPHDSKPADDWRCDGHGPYSETSAFENLDAPRTEYPVIVTDTRTHVVWVEADSPAEAERYAQYDTYELVNSENFVDGGMSSKAPDKIDVEVWGDSWLSPAGPSSYSGTVFGPWRLEEPRTYGWRNWAADHVARVEARMAEAAAAHAVTGTWRDSQYYT